MSIALPWMLPGLRFPLISYFAFPLSSFLSIPLSPFYIVSFFFLVPFCVPLFLHIFLSLHFLCSLLSFLLSFLCIHSFFLVHAACQGPETFLVLLSGCLCQATSKLSGVTRDEFGPIAIKEVLWRLILMLSICCLCFVSSKQKMYSMWEGSGNAVDLLPW